MARSLAHAAVAEGVGTFALVVLGPGAAVVQAQTGVLGPLGVPLVFGLTVVGVLTTLGPVSGAHINPAATLALTLAGRFPWAWVAPYVAAQLTGAVLGALALLALLGRVGDLGVTVPAGHAGPSFALELGLSFCLLLAALRSGRPWVVGGVVALAAALGGPVSGASMNPARSFGPALVSGIWTAHWLYWAAPALGAVLAAGVHRGLEHRAALAGPAVVDRGAAG
ncbi:MIP/aquaporin family protein [Deinococcus multiflagellatus]|uniref:MIP/aquaporin family protein n=1 Tax=Deinococcus multiflagellatus TaxID=1656887 RepID=A0ABW1ZIS0_9DEIO|nr:aquaporin [Deinococcus multiflagellatus]MBZ9711941.1 aquaporin [Deinococcus multiflagellatus]